MREDHEMSLGNHLEELRKCITRSLIGVLIAACVAGVFYKEVMTTLLQPYMVAWRTVEEKYGPPAATSTDGAVTPTAAAITNTAVTGTVLAERPPRMTPHILMGSPATGILAIIMVTTIVGVLLASPWVIYQIWSFVGVGLKDRERKFIRIYGAREFPLICCRRGPLLQGGPAARPGGPDGPRPLDHRRGHPDD